MQTFTLHELLTKPMIGDEVFCLYPEALDEIQWRNERNTELERALQSCMAVLSRQIDASGNFIHLAQQALSEGAKALEAS